ncbi:cytotoxin [Cedecea neteri]|uniref:Toxin CcdB n=1 Tax=Cedecea neteri TaxID=158822 RepID=A0A089Q598_9ENTR|nr:CcdB family protein [Cedecea neteri]AIR06406.1 cytotoxin [Cedecea neteri]
MQFTVYKNTGRPTAYPYLLNVQSNIIGRRNTRVVIPLFPAENYKGPRTDKLTPSINLAGEDFIVMTHELASIPERVLGAEHCSAAEHENTIKAALNFLFYGIE